MPDKAENSIVCGFERGEPEQPGFSKCERGDTRAFAPLDGSKPAVWLCSRHESWAATFNISPVED